jgi:hypothetical protein
LINYLEAITVKNKSKIKSEDGAVDIMELYWKMYSMDSIALKLYAQMRREGIDTTQAQVRTIVEDTVLLAQRRKN